MLEDLQPLVICAILGKAGVGGEAFVAPDDLSVYSNTKGDSQQGGLVLARGTLHPFRGTPYVPLRPNPLQPHLAVRPATLLPV